jgi:hypothetical protein
MEVLDELGLFINKKVNFSEKKIDKNYSNDFITLLDLSVFKLKRNPRAN